MRRYYAAFMVMLFILMVFTPSAIASDGYHYGWSRPVEIGTSDTSAGFVDIIHTEDGQLATVVVNRHGDSKKVELLTVNPTNLETKTVPLFEVDANEPLRDLKILESRPGQFHMVWQSQRTALHYASFTTDGEYLVEPMVLPSTTGIVKNGRMAIDEDRVVLLWSEMYESRYRIFVSDFDVDDVPGTDRQVLVDYHSDNAVEAAHVLDNELVLLYSHPDPILERQTHYIKVFTADTFESISEELRIHSRANFTDRYLRASMTLDDGRMLFMIPDQARTYSILWVGELKDGQVETITEKRGWEYFSGDLAIAPDGELHGVWIERFSQHNSEVVQGLPETQESTRLTYGTRVKVLPTLIFDQDGYRNVVFHDLGTREFTLYLSTDRFPEDPSIWHWLGLDTDNFWASFGYSFIEVMMMSTAQTFFSVFAFGIAFGILVILRSMGISGKTKLSFRLEIILVFTICFLLRPWFIFTSPESVSGAYELFSFVMAGIMTLAIMTFGLKAYQDEPLSLLLAGFGWVLFFQIMVLVPQVQTLIR